MLPTSVRLAAISLGVVGLLVACGSGKESTFTATPPPQDDGGKGLPSGHFENGTPDGGSAHPDCKPLTCAAQGIECGPAGDGCGGIIAECGKCGPGLRCGGPNAPSKCVSPSIGAGCVPRTCESQGVHCGSAGDGCGGTLACGSCQPGAQCGSTDKPSQCVAGGDGCMPLAACPADACGPIADGCGGVLACGGCISPTVCGGGGVPSVCGGGNQCTPKTQAAACSGLNCGFEADGCGGVYTCGVGSGACPGGGICGSDSPNVCGSLGGPCFANADACAAGSDCCSGNCVNGACAAAACVADTPTKGACTTNAQCCSGLCTGGLCQSLGTACRGSGNACTLDSQCCSGGCINGTCSSAVSFCKQKNDVCNNNSACCSGNCVKSVATALTGTCGDPGGTGVSGCAIAGTLVNDCAAGSGCTSSCCSRSCGSDGAAAGHKICQNPSGCHPTGELCQVDSDCCGWDQTVDPHGGGQAAFCSKNAVTDQFGRCNSGGGCNEPGIICKIDSTATCSASTANNCCEALNLPSGSSCNSDPNNCCRQDSKGVPRCILDYARCKPGTPAPIGQLCGSDADCCGNPCTFSLENGKNVGRCQASCVADGGSCTTTSDCCGGGCVKPPGSTRGVCQTPTCTPKDCSSYPGKCGVMSDGCGGFTADCGPCVAPQTCGGGGVANVCGGQLCTPNTCASLGIECGSVPDGCGALLTCPSCPEGQTCGGGGVPYKCGFLPCAPKTCAELGAQCGQLADGCGGLTPSCGSCTGNLACVNGLCLNACTPRTCASVGANCGSIADGCGGSVDCGTCSGMDQCGYNTANVCGQSVPR